MSADEIRQLAFDLSPKKGVYCVDLKLNELVYSALLAYAAMVERCERLKFNMIPHKHDTEIVDHILKGTTK